MEYEKFLERIISDGIAAAKADYTRLEQKEMREGSIEGFEACRGKQPPELATLLENARAKTREARHLRNESYWRIRCFELEVEWVCNVISAGLYNEGKQIIVPVTARGMMKAAEIIGVKGEARPEIANGR